MKQYRREPWLNPKVVIGSSPIHGKGMFATAPISRGETIAIWGGNFVSKEEAEQVREAGTLIQQIDDAVFEVFTYENRGDDPTYFQNHSCDPNTWMNDEVTISARREIDPGEELTIDYAMFETNDDYVAIERCACGLPKCRGRITGGDWRLLQLQRDYSGHFSPMNNRRITEQQERPPEEAQ